MTPENTNPPSVVDPVPDTNERAVQLPVKSNSNRSKRTHSRKNAAESVNGETDEGILN